MSPARRGSRRKRRLWWLAIPALVFLIGVFWGARRSSTGIRYDSIQVKRGDLQISVLATGQVLPENRLEIKPPIAGRIEEVLVHEGQEIKKGQILAWMSSSERAALLDAARAQGPAEIKKWEGLYKPTPVVAPIDGTIILKTVESGQTFSNTDAILVMSDRLTVKAQVDETDISQIQLKQGAEIILDAYPETKISGQVDQIGFEAKQFNSVTTYVVDVLPDQTPDFMRAGMTANVTFKIEAKTNVLLIPNEALKMRDGKALTMIPSTTGPVEHEITVGASDGKLSEVLSGLQENDTVLVRQISSGSGNLFAPLRGPHGG